MDINTIEPGNDLKLFAVLLGCTPHGKNIEQHDMFFGVARQLEDLKEDMKTFWHKMMLNDVTGVLKKILPGLDSTALNHELHKTFTQRDKVHIDAWAELQYADGYKISIQPKPGSSTIGEQKLYFINLGGYKEHEFEEFHKKIFVVAGKPSEALEKAKSNDFMKEYSPQRLGKAAIAHLDDKHKIDFEADDIICISENIGNNYTLVLEPVTSRPAQALTVGYIPLTYTAG